MPRNEALINILSIICNVFEAHSVVLFLPDGQHGYCVAQSFSLGDEVLPQGSPVQKKSLTGIVIGKNEPLFINNMDRKGATALGYYSSREDGKIKAFMGTPLDNSMGALCLDSKRTYSFSTKDLKILSQFARLITLTLSCIHSMDAEGKRNEYFVTLKLVHNLRKRQPKWHAFLENFLEMISTTSTFSHCSLTVMDQRGSSYFIEGSNRPLFRKAPKDDEGFPIGSGLVGWVYKNQEPIYIDGTSPGQASSSIFGGTAPTYDFTGVICIPLVFQRKARGVLVFANEEPVNITDDLKDFLAMVSEYLTQFLENLFLRSRLAEARSALQKITPSSEKPVLINDN
ncbi:GAF domain-containing protein [Maridesulfovibrio bastinii]|jgi:transcriptional regulator with GAF, ATPase, and Fis domain|uniref:GAF domain-containing protein n=1 Tax=Maridesulfovibrio bastinii TaxID=47157 RepID=UPI000485B573|nr:GAF domain-containing protein [Maridesulfovibrio bastinii]